MYAKFATARDAAEARALDGVDPEQRAVLLDLLAPHRRRPAGDAVPCLTLASAVFADGAPVGGTARPPLG